MKRLVFPILLTVIVAGCASARYLETPTGSTELTAFIASAGPFVQRGDDCVFGVVFKDGVRTEIKLRGERCAAATAWLRVEATLRQQAQAAAAARLQAAPPVPEPKPAAEP